jgi:hypothetical protein
MQNASTLCICPHRLLCFCTHALCSNEPLEWVCANAPDYMENPDHWVVNTQLLLSDEITSIDETHSTYIYEKILLYTDIYL